MKPAIAKFLIAIYLFSFTPLKELNRIPLLFRHYAQHLEEDSPMTVICMVSSLMRIMNRICSSLLKLLIFHPYRFLCFSIIKNSTLLKKLPHLL